MVGLARVVLKANPDRIPVGQVRMGRGVPEAVEAPEVQEEQAQAAQGGFRRVCFIQAQSLQARKHARSPIMQPTEALAARMGWMDPLEVWVISCKRRQRSKFIL